MIVSMFTDMDNFGKIHFKNELPACLIYCDPLRLGQVIDNVISNSYKYAIPILTSGLVWTKQTKT